MTDMMKQAQAVQQKMKWVQQKVANMEMEGKAGGGMVKVIVNGTYEAKKVTLDPSVFNEEKKTIEDLICVAINDARRQVEEVLKLEMMKLTKEFNLPADGGTGGAQGQGGATGASGSQGQIGGATGAGGTQGGAGRLA